MSKSKIFEVAEKHFFARRYSDVKLDNIANDLWIRKPSLYYYFVDKKDFFMQTLKFSMEKYINELKNIVEEKDVDKFIEWYLIFPSEKKNLFAISFQKWYCVDLKINSVIYNWKLTVNKIIEDFLSSFDLNNVRRYLLINLLDKLAQDNCTDWYCLAFWLDDVKEEIKDIMWI